MAKQTGPDFGSLGFYSGGRMLPEGDYALDFTLKMHAGTKADGTPAGPERLGVMLTCFPIGKDGAVVGEGTEHFLSMGTKAGESYAPDADTGKSLVSIPGGPGIGPNNKTNWFAFLKSLYDSGLPEGILSNDFTVVDGVWVHIQNVPEPEDRKSFRATTGEAGIDEKRGGGMMAVVTEILDGGAPWEGGGGITTSKKAAKPGPRGVVKHTIKAAPAPAAKKKATGSDDDEVKSAAETAIAGVLEAKPDGCKRLILQTGSFKLVKVSDGDEMASKVADLIKTDDDTLSSILGELGFELNGSDIKPTA